MLTLPHGTGPKPSSGFVWVLLDGFQNPRACCLGSTAAPAVAADPGFQAGKLSRIKLAHLVAVYARGCARRLGDRWYVLARYKQPWAIPCGLPKHARPWYVRLHELVRYFLDRPGIPTGFIVAGQFSALSECSTVFVHPRRPQRPPPRLCH